MPTQQQTLQSKIVFIFHLKLSSFTYTNIIFFCLFIFQDSCMKRKFKIESIMFAVHMETTLLRLLCKGGFESTMLDDQMRKV